MAVEHATIHHLGIELGNIPCGFGSKIVGSTVGIGCDIQCSLWHFQPLLLHHCKLLLSLCHNLLGHVSSILLDSRLDCHAIVCLPCNLSGGNAAELWVDSPLLEHVLAAWQVIDKWGSLLHGRASSIAHLGLGTIQVAMPPYIAGVFQLATKGTVGILLCLEVWPHVCRELLGIVADNLLLLRSQVLCHLHTAKFVVCNRCTIHGRWDCLLSHSCSQKLIDSLRLVIQCRERIAAAGSGHLAFDAVHIGFAKATTELINDGAVASIATALGECSTQCTNGSKVGAGDREPCGCTHALVQAAGKRLTTFAHAQHGDVLGRSTAQQLGIPRLVGNAHDSALASLDAAKQSGFNGACLESLNPLLGQCTLPKGQPVGRISQNV